MAGSLRVVGFLMAHGFVTEGPVKFDDIDKNPGQMK